MLSPMYLPKSLWGALRESSDSPRASLTICFILRLFTSIFHTRSFGLGCPGAWFVFAFQVAWNTQGLYFKHPVPLRCPHPPTPTQWAHTQSCFPLLSLFHSCSFRPSVLTSYLLSIMKHLSFQLNFCSLFPPTLPAGFYSLWMRAQQVSHTARLFPGSFFSFLPDCKVLEGWNHIISILLVCTAPNYSDMNTQNDLWNGTNLNHKDQIPRVMFLEVRDSRWTRGWTAGVCQME